MPVPAGTVVVTGAIVDTSGILLATIALRDAGAVALYGGRLRRVNEAGDGWIDIPDHHIGSDAPAVATRFLGQLWLDTTTLTTLILKAWNGTAFVTVGGGGGGLTEAQALALIATWARATDPTGNVPIDRLPGLGIHPATVTYTAGLRRLNFILPAGVTLRSGESIVFSAPSGIGSQPNGASITARVASGMASSIVGADRLVLYPVDFIYNHVYQLWWAGTSFVRFDISENISELPSHTANEINRYLVTTDQINGYVLRRGASPALPAGPRRVVTTNPAGDNYELTVPLERDDIYPHVSALPDYTNVDSPELAFLEHDIVTGIRGDATVTLGEWVTGSGQVVGYTENGVIGTPGNINRTSPLVEIEGTGTLASYALSKVSSLNREWLDSFTHVVIDNVEFPLLSSYRQGASTWVRSIQGGPVGYSASSITLNFKHTDGTHYFVGSGATIQAVQGLYEKLSHGYSRFASTGYSSQVGRGAPTHDPDYGGQQFVNELGQVWFAASEILVFSAEAIGTNAIFTNTKYVRDPDNRPEVLAQGGDGGFYWVDQLGDPNFEQFLGTTPADLDRTRNWEDLWTYIYGVTGQTNAVNLRLRDHSIFLGGFSTPQAAYDALGLLIQQADFDADSTDYYFGLTSPLTSVGIWNIVTWTAPVLEATDHLRWNGPFLTEENVAVLVQEESNNPITPREILFDNTDSTDVGLTADLRLGLTDDVDKWDAIGHVDMVLSRKIVLADNNYDLDINASYSTVSHTIGVSDSAVKRHINKRIPAGIFREWVVNSQVTGNSIQEGEAVYVMRAGLNSLTTWGEMFLLFTRGQNADNSADRIRVGFGVDRQSVNIREWRATVTLIPR